MGGFFFMHRNLLPREAKDKTRGGGYDIQKMVSQKVVPVEKKRK